MEGGEGMVAVVRGLRDSGLAVTLLDGNREYTLMPNSMLQNTSPSPTMDVSSFRASKQQSTQHNAILTEPVKDGFIRNTGVQVTDGRYASIYKMSHCHVKPSSPPLELTEFPPQRAAVCPGHGNFEVGGAGSGETYVPVKANGKFRGGMNWPDKGSVCTPRPSHEADAFANSLRKYPCVSPDRSTEIVERLINYTQSRVSKTFSIKNQTSPQRSPDCNSSHNLKYSRTSTPKTSIRYEAKDRSRVEESPTRDRSMKAEGDAPESRKTYFRSYDVKCFKDLPKRAKENVRIISSYPYKESVCSNIKESYDNMPLRSRRHTEHYGINAVNTEIQAAVRMVSREVATVPRPEPTRRTIAAQLTPTSSNADTTEGDLPNNTKSTQKSYTLKRKFVQTVSFTDLTSSDNELNCTNSRKSKSQEELRLTEDKLKKKALAVFDNVSWDDRTKERLKEEYLKRLPKDRGLLKSKATYNRCVNTISIPRSCEKCNERLTSDDRAINTSVYGNTTHVYQAVVTPFNVNESIDFAIKKWVDGLPISSKNLGSDRDKTYILNNMAFKLKELIVIRFRNEIANLKTDILEMVKEVPMDTNVCCNKSMYLNKSVVVLLEKIKTTFVYQTNDCDYRNVRVNTPVTVKAEHTSPCKEYLKDFVRKQLWNYFHGLKMNITDYRIRDIENELTDIIANAIDSGDHRDVTHQMKYILRVIGNLTDAQSKYLINVIIEKFKLITMTNSYSQVLTVLQNASQNSSTINNTDLTIEALTEGDLNANLDLYMNQLCTQIDDWLNNLNVRQIQDGGFRQVVVHDLAGDIIDRHKYLEFNPTSRGTDKEEIEQLKYQIFKWINKLVGEDNMETIQHAEELMTRIRTIPVPMLKIPPPHTQKDVSSNRARGNTYPSPQYQSSYSNKCNTDQTVDSSNTGRRINSSGEVNAIPNAGQRSIGTNMAKPNMPTGHVSSYTETKPILNTVDGVNVSGSDPMKSRNRQSFGAPEHSPKLNSTHERTTSPMPQSPQINRNITDSKMSSSVDEVSTRDTNIRLSVGTSPGLTITGNTMFPKQSFSEPAAIISDPTEMQTNIVNKQMPFEKNTNAVTPLEVNRPMNEESRPLSSNNNNMSTPPNTCSPIRDSTSLSIKQLNEEFDDFLKRWVQEIPIAVSKPDEHAVAEKARLGLYNGLWKAITKLKFEPSIFYNRFYYQDVLDDEIEDLLNILPKTPELETMKHALKAKLIEKTTDTNEQILSLAATATFRQQLVENVENSLPVLDKTDENVARFHEDLQKLCLAKDYILYIRYKDDDQVKANVYRKKLLNNVETLVDDLKKNHGQELKDIDPALYMNEVVSALNKVPLPSENTIREEADEILLGIEVEQWYSDLPLVENIDYTVQLQRKRFRDALVKNIHDLEKERSLSDYEASKELKEHIMKFLEKVPLREGTDINFVIEELVNRLRNRPRDGVRRKSVAFQAPQGFQEFQNNMPHSSTMRNDQNEDTELIRRRSVGFQEPQDYQEFSRNMPCCSSLSEQPALKDSPKSWPSFQTPDGEWLSLEETRLPPSMAQNGGQPQSFEQDTPKPERSYSSRNSQFNEIPQSYTNMPQQKQYGPKNCCGHPTCRNSNNHFRDDNQRYQSELPIPQNIQGIAGGGGSYGVLGTSQTAGPSGVNSRTAPTQLCNTRYGQGGNTKFYKSTDRNGIQECIQNKSTQQQNNSKTYPSSEMTGTGQPIGFSTPKQLYKEKFPERPTKNYQQVQRPAEEVRRRLEMEDTESEMERETCRCMERCKRRRRRPIMVSCEEYDMKCPQLIPIRCPYAYFFLK